MLIYPLREEQDLLEILDPELIGVKILVLILIEPFLATLILIDSCLVWRKGLTLLLDSRLLRTMYWQSCLALAWIYFENWTLSWTNLDRFYKFKRQNQFKRVLKPNIHMNINVDLSSECLFCSHWELNFGLLSFLNLACNWDFVF